ncbi:transcriptional coactivator p15/PC4 family protein [Frigidibacter sp. MR17.24]|uniref:transcriptional coactivator p15/PC4 family protein n=1 Tax=Frigidibacter sp. MR17.24 TaxID=3127345 RepID=UPI003012A565
MAEVHTFTKNSREEVRISLDDFRGMRVVNLRVWFETQDGTMRPGKQGLALRVEALPELLHGLHLVDAMTSGGGRA